MSDLYYLNEKKEAFSFLLQLNQGIPNVLYDDKVSKHLRPEAK